MEFVGRTNDGRRFMGIVPSKAIANVVECYSWQMLSIPDHWTLEDAATIYFAYGKVLRGIMNIKYRSTNFTK